MGDNSITMEFPVWNRTILRVKRLLLIIVLETRHYTGLLPCQNEMYNHSSDKSPERVILQNKELNIFGKEGHEGNQTSGWWVTVYCIRQVSPTFSYFQFLFPTSNIFLNPIIPYIHKHYIYMCASPIPVYHVVCSHSSWCLAQPFPFI